MNLETVIRSDHYYKGNDLSPGPMTSPSEMETTVPSAVHSGIEGKQVDEDVTNEEREKEIERWMSDIKMFIRKIDTGSL